VLLIACTAISLIASQSEARRRQLTNERAAAEASLRQLRAIQDILDAALGHLSTNDLIRELLVRISVVLGVDNVAILIPTDDSRQLVVHMAHGPEAETADQVHVPIAQGIAEMIAATRQELIVDDLRTVEVANPFHKQAIRSLMGVPLVVDDRLVGVLHVGMTAPRHFTEDDLLLLRLMAYRIGPALDHVHLYEEEQRRRTEAAYRAGEMEAVFEAIADGVFVFDRQGELLRRNSAGRDLLDMNESRTLSARPPSDRSGLPKVLDEHDHPLAPAEWPLFRVLRGEVLKGEQAVDLKVHTGAGMEREISVSGAPIHDEGGTITGAVCVVRDVTERRRLEGQILAERNHLQQVIDALPEGIMIAAANPPTVTTMNRVARQLLGADLIGMPVPIPAPGREGEFAARHMDGTPYALEDLPLERALLRGDVVRGDQFLIRNAADGREITILANSAPILGPQGAVEGAVEAFQDISALKDLERRREEFLAAMSHDLKNPLTSIIGMSQLLQRRIGHIEEGEQAHFANGLGVIVQTAKQMAAQINELLDVTRVQMGRPLLMELAPTDVVALLKRVAEEYRQTAERHTLLLRHEDDSLISMVDSARLNRAFANILANAVKYSPEGGDILVAVVRGEDQDGAWIEISVTDHGVGIPSAEIDQVFQGFYRAGNVTERFSGTGLGLTGVRQVVEGHGGTITLESTEGMGTVVTIRIPWRPPTKTEAEAD
jgi:signal transduction histidine kinase/GAF domain-containing protein